MPQIPTFLNRGSVVVVLLNNAFQFVVYLWLIPPPPNLEMIVLIILYNFFFFYKFIYLFLGVLGLRFCARALSSCGEWGPLFIAVRGPLHCRGLSCCGAQAPDAQAQ